MKKTKICSKCHKEKRLSEFSKDQLTSMGYKSQCKQCWKDYYLEHKQKIDKQHKSWRENNKDKISAWRKRNKKKLKSAQAAYFQQNKEEIYQQHNEWVKNNKEKVKEQSRKSYYKNREKRLKKNRNYYLKNRERLLQYSRNWYNKHKEERKAHQKAYQLKNQEKRSLYGKIYYQKNKKVINKKHKIRLKDSPSARIANNLRTRIGRLILKQNKSIKTIELVGCSFDFLREYLEFKFKNGMNWSNYGRGDKNKKEWHIDHIIPLETFNLTDPKQQKIANNYTNLQPLWATENLSKGARIL